jgi:hypothetical protein
MKIKKKLILAVRNFGRTPKDSSAEKCLRIKIKQKCLVCLHNKAAGYFKL